MFKRPSLLSYDFNTIKLSSLRMRNDLHIVRKLWHVLTGLAGVIAYKDAHIHPDRAATYLLILSAVIFAFEQLRLKNEKVNALIMTFARPIMRESERNNMSGMPFYALGASLSLFFFPEKIAVLSVLFLIFADPISSFFGILYGTEKIFANKSLQGSLAGFTVCYLLTMVYGIHYGATNIQLLFFALVAGFVGALSELCSHFVDDNLCIPVLSGLGLTLLNLLIPIFN